MRPFHVSELKNYAMYATMARELNNDFGTGMIHQSISRRETRKTSVSEFINASTFLDMISTATSNGTKMTVDGVAAVGCVN